MMTYREPESVFMGNIYKKLPVSSQAGTRFDHSESRSNIFPSLAEAFASLQKVKKVQTEFPKYAKQVCHQEEDTDYEVRDTPQWYSNQNLIPKTTAKWKGPSRESQSTIPGGTIFRDEVTGYSISEWPQDAEEWKTRPSCWPPAPLIEQVLKTGHQIVPKLTDHTGNDGPFEIMITFTLAEVLLAKHRNPTQRLVYLIAKTIFYSHLDLQDETNPEIRFPSYALKTCMMWLMEETPVDAWTEDNVWIKVEELFKKLHDAVKSGFLPKYFLIQANVLNSCPETLLLKVAAKLKDINADLLHYATTTDLFITNRCLMVEGFADTLGRCEARTLQALWNLIRRDNQVNSTLKVTIQRLEQNNCQGLHAKGYNLDSDECLQVLKGAMQISSEEYVTGRTFNERLRTGHSRHVWYVDDVLENVLQLKVDIPDTHVQIIRVCKGHLIKAIPAAPSTYIQSLRIVHEIGDSDAIFITRGKNQRWYKFSTIPQLAEHFKRHLYTAIGKRMRKLYKLTHKENTKQQEKNVEVMIDLLYRRDDKRMPNYDYGDN